MSTAPVQTTFSAFADRDLALVRVSGPGTCRDSGRFETLLLEVEKRGFSTLVMDLEDCPRLDSTFAGALLRMAARTVGRAQGPGPSRLVLANPQAQVRELLDTLCVSQFFEQVQIPSVNSLEPMEIPDRDLSKREVMALSLDGHERLAALNDANARRFASLLPLLREELQKPPTDPRRA